MVQIIIIALVLFLVDTVGYNIKCKHNQKFANYHLKHVPFIWVWYS